MYDMQDKSNSRDVLQLVILEYSSLVVVGIDFYKYIFCQVRTRKIVDTGKHQPYPGEVVSSQRIENAQWELLVRCEISSWQHEHARIWSIVPCVRNPHSAYLPKSDKQRPCQIPRDLYSSVGVVGRYAQWGFWTPGRIDHIPAWWCPKELFSKRIKISHCALSIRCTKDNTAAGYGNRSKEHSESSWSVLKSAPEDARICSIIYRFEKPHSAYLAKRDHKSAKISREYCILPSR